MNSRFLIKFVESLHQNLQFMRTSIYLVFLTYCFSFYAIPKTIGQWSEVKIPADYKPTGFYNAGSVTYAESDLIDQRFYASPFAPASKYNTAIRIATPFSS